MKFTTFGKKQLKILTWWTTASPYSGMDGIIADGAIRSGKSLSMSVSYVFWAMATFDGCQFGMSGKSVGSFNRNVVFWMLPILKQRGYKVEYKHGDNLLIVRKTIKGVKKENYFFIFGGRDESSYATIQGMTAAGWYFDEAALQPETFVNQAMGRCSVEGAKFWFNCNPDKPSHWFKADHIDKSKEKNYYHIHFVLEDNPSLSNNTISRYKRMFSGVFYLRYILGLWVLADGVIFDMFTEADNCYTELTNSKKIMATKYLAIDYGTTNPLACYYIYDTWDCSYADDELYYSSKTEGKQLTDGEYGDLIDEFVKSYRYQIEAIILDPSAASLKIELKNRGYRVKSADNEVLEGIKVTGSALYQKKFMINKRCKNLIGEVGGYVWDAKAKDRGEEKPIKINDHGCDAIRYYINTIMKRRILGRG